MKLSLRHLVFAMAFIVWGACVAGALGLVGAGQALCVGDGHYVPGCRAEAMAVLILLFFAILIGGAWLLKRLARRLEINLG